MNARLRKRHRWISRALASRRAKRLAPRAHRLANAAFAPRARETQHARLRADLPTFVDAELDGWHRDARWADVRVHLRTCEKCAALYAELVEIATMDLQSKLPEPIIVPDPRADFLESPDE